MLKTETNDEQKLTGWRSKTALIEATSIAFGLILVVLTTIGLFTLR